MFLPLASCMFFLLVISFVHWCLSLAVPVCPQRNMSLPSICRDFLFTWLIPSGYISAQLSSPCASLSGNAASREGDTCLSRLRGDPLESRHPPCWPAASCCAWMRAGGLGKDCMRVLRSLWLPAPLSLCLAFAAELGDFLVPPAARVISALLLSQHAGWIRKPRGPAAKCPYPMLWAQKALCWSSRLMQGRSVCGGGRSRVRTVQRWAGKWDGWLLRQGEWFQNRRQGGGISLPSASTWTVFSIITTVLAGPAGRERGSAGWAVFRMEWCFCTLSFCGKQYCSSIMKERKYVWCSSLFWLVFHQWHKGKKRQNTKSSFLV